MTHFIFDCDDVLLDWQSGFTTYLADRGIDLDPAGPQVWNLAEWIGCSDEAAASWVRRFNSSAYFALLAAMPGARDLVWALRDAGHTISVLTCCGSAPLTHRMRMHNLHMAFRRGHDTHQCDDPFEGKIDILPLGASKFGKLGDFAKMPILENIVFVEDNFTHARSGVENGIKTYCLRRTHNRRDEVLRAETGVIWIDSLDDLARQYIQQKVE